MVKTDKRRKAPRLPSQIDRAIAAAEDKKAVDLVVENAKPISAEEAADAAGRAAAREKLWTPESAS